MTGVQTCALPICFPVTIYNFMPMSTKQKFLVVVLVLVAIVSACSITIQVQRNNTNSTQENSQETNQSADSARVNFHLNP